MKPKALNEATGNYFSDDEVIQLALAILEHRFGLKGPAMNSPQAVRDYVRLAITEREHEVFCVAYLDAKHRVIAFEELFRGTLTQAAVYPREVAKRCLAHNCAAVIFA